MFVINQRRGCTNGERRIESSLELAERWNKVDPKVGVCIAYYVSEDRKFYWNTWEYNAEDKNNYYIGHYFMEDEAAAWKDYFERCSQLVDDYKKYYW